jgi:hypothetical protein
MVVRPESRTTPVEVPGHPDIYLATIKDTRFAIPRSSGCGLFTSVVDRRFGVPAPSGRNEITLPTYTSIKQYDASHR